MNPDPDEDEEPRHYVLEVHNSVLGQAATPPGEPED